MRDDYKGISKFYNLLGCVYSFGAVGRCRGFVLEQVKAGMKVCFLGVGEGREAVEAVEMGASVTVVDCSLSMLDCFEKRLVGGVRGVVDVEVYHGDVIDFCDRCEVKYDLVVSNFFLNVFSDLEMVDVLEKVLGLCGSSGGVVIGDFWYDEEAGRVVRWLERVNWSVALFVFRRFACNARHQIYVYDFLLERGGFGVVKEKVFNVLGIPVYRSIVAKRFKVCAQKKGLF